MFLRIQSCFRLHLRSIFWVFIIQMGIFSCLAFDCFDAGGGGVDDFESARCVRVETRSQSSQELQNKDTWGWPYVQTMDIMENEEIENYKFLEITNVFSLKKIYFKELLKISGGFAVVNATVLEEFNLPNLQEADLLGFQMCPKLRVLEFPMLRRASLGFFANNLQSLEVIALPRLAGKTEAVRILRNPSLKRIDIRSLEETNEFEIMENMNLQEIHLGKNINASNIKENNEELKIIIHPVGLQSLGVATCYAYIVHMFVPVLLFAIIV